jgi:hypothetical protein
MQTVNLKISRIKEKLESALRSKAQKVDQGLTQEDLDFLCGLNCKLDALGESYAKFVNTRDSFIESLQAVGRFFKAVLEHPSIGSTETDRMNQIVAEMTRQSKTLPKNDELRPLNEDSIRLMLQTIKSAEGLGPYLKNRDLLITGFAIIGIATDELQGFGEWIDSLPKPEELQRRFQVAQIREKMKSWLNEFKSGSIIVPEKTSYMNIILTITQFLNQISLTNFLHKSLDLLNELFNKSHFSKETLEAIRDVNGRCIELIEVYSEGKRVFDRCAIRIAALKEKAKQNT